MKRDSKVALVVMWLLALIGVLAVMVFLLVFVLDGARGVSSHSLAIATEQCAAVLLVAIAAWSLSARRSRQRGASAGKIPGRFPVPALSSRRREQAPSSQVRDALPQGAHEGDDVPSSPAEDGPARQQPAYVDRAGTVLDVVSMRPWRLGRPRRRCASVLEALTSSPAFMPGRMSMACAGFRHRHGFRRRQGLSRPGRLATEGP